MMDPTKPPHNPTGQPETPADQSERLRTHQDLLQWLSPLCASPEFQRFLAWMRAGQASNAKQALDLTKTPEERNNFAQRHHAIAEIAAWPEQQLASSIQQLKTAAARQAAPAQPPNGL